MADDQFAAADDTITLTQSTMGETLYAPVFAQLDPFQSVKPRTWRKLTVADKLEIVGDDVARAWRIRIGDRQWVIYKSFSGIGNRTFLGQNHTCDLLIGRFQKDGNVEDLLILEP